MLLSTATSPTTSPYLKVWKGVAPLSTTIVPNRLPKSKVRKGVAPLSLRSVPPSSPTTTLCPKFGKVSLRYRFAPYRHRPQPPPYVQSSERCRSATASLRTAIVPNRHPEIAKGVCHKGLMSLSKGTVLKKCQVPK